MQSALEEVYSSSERLAVAGRTDTGVHALAQVASVDVGKGPPLDRAAEALNAVLPDDVAVLAGEEAPPDFHARHSARSRSYGYRIFTRRAPSPFEARRALWYPRPIDRGALEEAAAVLVGDHDFRAFTPAVTRHEAFGRKVLAARWLDLGEILEFEITANSFLRHMVRTLVGTMLELPPAFLAELLDGAHVRADAGTTAPPWGLYLERVEY